MPIEVKSNFKLKAKELEKYARQLSDKYLKVGMYYLLNEVSNISIVEHMIHYPTTKEAMAAPVHSSKITIRTANLARSVLEMPSFNRQGVKKSSMQGILTPDVKLPGKSKEGIIEGYKKVVISGSTLEGFIGTDVFYAEENEEGLYGKKARPFLKPAAKESIATGREIFRKVIEQSFKKEAI